MASVEELLLVGRIARAHGIRGQVIVNPETDFAEDRFRVGQVLLVGPEDRAVPRRVTEARFQQGRPVVALEGIDVDERRERAGGRRCLAAGVVDSAAARRERSIGTISSAARSGRGKGRRQGGWRSTDRSTVVISSSRGSGRVADTARGSHLRAIDRIRVRLRVIADANSRPARGCSDAQSPTRSRSRALGHEYRGCNDSLTSGSSSPSFRRWCRRRWRMAWSGGQSVAASLDVAVHDLRDFTTDRHRVVDDMPFGGGPGMVMKPEPFFAAVERIRDTRGAPGDDRADDARWRAVHAPPGGAVERARARGVALRPLRRR